MVAYSINFILLFGFIYHAIVSWCKNDLLGWVLIFFFTLITLDSFYFLPPELYQGAAFMLLWFAILLHDPLMKRRWTFLILLLLIIPILSDSRLTPMYFLFSAAFFWLNHPTKWNKKFYLLIAFFFVCMFIHSNYLVADYDTGKMKDFQRHLETYRSNLFGIPAHLKFLDKCLKIYYFYPILLLIVIGRYIVATFRKEAIIKFPVLKILGVLFSNFFFIMVLHIGSPNTTYRFYAEVNYLPLMIFVGIPFMFDVAANIKKEQWLLGGLVIVMALRLNTIGANHKKFEGRLDYYRHQMELGRQQSTNRTMRYVYKIPNHTVIQPWATAYETLLLSSLEGPEKAKSFLIYEDLNIYKNKIDSSNVFLTYFHVMTMDELNPIYFQLEDNKYLNLDKQ